MIKIIATVLAILPNNYWKKIVFFQFLLVMVSILELLGVVSVGPFIAVATNPDQALDNQIFNPLTSFKSELSAFEKLVVIGVVFSIILIFVNVLSLFAKIVSTRLSSGLAAELAQKLFHSYLHLPYEALEKRNSSHLVSNVTNDINNLCNKLIFSLMQLNAAVIAVLILLGLVFYINALAALFITLIYSMAYGGVYLFVNAKLKQNGYDLAVVNRGKVKVTLDALASIVSVKLYDRFDYFIQQLGSRFSRDGQLKVEHRLYQDLPYHVVDAVTFIAIVGLVLLVSATEGSSSSMMSQLAVIGLAGYRLIPKLQLIYRSIVTVKSNQKVLFELSDLLCHAEQANQIGYTQETISGAHSRLEFKNVSFGYQDSDVCLSDINMTICGGEFVGVFGRSGAGKSTIVKLLLGLIKPTAGSIEVMSMSDKESNRSGKAPSASLVEAETYIYNASLIDNITLFASHVDEVKLDLALKVSLFDEVMETKSLSLDCCLEEKSGLLSSGQRQKLGFARAFYFSSTFLILDEATNALDEASQKLILDGIKSYYSKVGVMIISHRPNLEVFLDKLYYLRDGSIKEQRA